MKKGILLFTALLFAISLQGQNTLRVIKGLVTDQAGQGLADKRVEARFYDCTDNTNQEILVESISNEEGYYELWLNICDNENIVVIAYCGGDFQSVDGLSFYEDSQEMNFNFDCNYDYNCDASFSYTYGEPNIEDGAIPFYFTAINPNDQDYFYEWAFLGALEEYGAHLDTPFVYYPTYGQYTVCMQTYIIGDPFNIVCEFCQSIDADFAVQSFEITNTETPNFAQDIRLFPNPTSTKVQLDFNLLKKEELTIEISNLLGQVLKQERRSFQEGKNQLSLDFSNYASGIYSISINASNGSGRFSRRVAKE